MLSDNRGGGVVEEEDGRSVLEDDRRVQLNIARAYR